MPCVVPTLGAMDASDARRAVAVFVTDTTNPPAPRHDAHRGAVMSHSTRVAWVIATWWGCGLSPVAPGTVGTLGALPLFLALRERGPAVILAVGLAIAAVGIWAAGRVAEATASKDPQRVVVDEVAGVLVALAAAPQSVGVPHPHRSRCPDRRTTRPFPRPGREPPSHGPCLHRPGKVMSDSPGTTIPQRSHFV